MTTAEIIGLVASLVTVFFSVIMALEAKFIKRLLKNGAINPEKAIEIPRMLPVMRWRVDRLKRAGAVRVTEKGRFFIDEDTYQSLRKKRRVFALFAMTTIAVIVTILLLVFL